MKRFISAVTYSLFLVVIALGLPLNEQKQPRPDNTETTNRDEERGKSAEECAAQGKPKPEVEKSMSKNWLLCGKAISLPKPTYPPEAREKRVSGVVAIEVVIDEAGRVIWAKAIEGPELLQGASIKAACQARYSPIKISGRAVKASGVITYNFVDK